MKKNVLLVEDDPALRMVMREVLKDEFDVDEADNGDDGISMGLDEGHDLILLDYQLPRQDGLAVIEAVKKAHPEVPVIVLSGYLSPRCEKQFTALGADRIFPKPFNYRKLLEEVRQLTDKEQAQTPAVAAPPPVAAPQSTAPEVQQELLVDSLNTVAALAEKIEFLQSITEKYWVEPSDIAALGEAVRCMDTEVKTFYGKMNNALFDSGDFASPLITIAKKPDLAGSN